MDSKYNAISQQQQQQTISPFNFKRKLMTNGHHINTNNDQKRFKSNSITANDFPKASNSSNTGQNANSNGKSFTIDEQRHQLPVYKVRKQ